MTSSWLGNPPWSRGPQKSLKTSVAWDLAISLITGKPFLGRFEVNRFASVAFFSGEGGLGSSKTSGFVFVVQSKSIWPAWTV